MSSFISSMPADGLMEMPPVSNVTALPTMPSTSRRRAFAGFQRITIMQGGTAEPWPTASSAPAPSRSSSRTPSTRQVSPGIPAASDFA